MHPGGPVDFALNEFPEKIPAEEIKMTAANQSLCDITAHLINCLNSNDELKNILSLEA